MKCLFPLSLKVEDSSESEFVLRNSYWIDVPCRHCIACKMNRTREWSLRLIMESRSFPLSDVAFTTLTYDNQHVPFFNDGSYEVLNLCKRDAQLFLKRLRRRLDYPIRYFLVGEYGSLRSRPHFHALLFGLKPCDVFLVDDAWRLGFTLTKSFYEETAGYVAGYVQKKLFGKDSYNGLTPPFLICSKGIGLDFFLKHLNQYAELNAIPYKGFNYPIPSYFIDKAVELGAIRKKSVEEVALSQLHSRLELLSTLERRGISETDYKEYQFKLATSKFNKSNFKRDNNMEF